MKNVLASCERNLLFIYITEKCSSLSYRHFCSSAETYCLIEEELQQYNDSYLLGATRGCTARVFGVPLILRFAPVSNLFLLKKFSLERTYGPIMSVPSVSTHPFHTRGQT